MRRACFSMLSACLVFIEAGSSAPGPGATRLPGPELNLRLAAPIETWDEAVPLGNGLMGGLLWGGDSTIKLSLDRGDLWDERPADGMRWELFTYANLIKKVREQDYTYIDDVFDRAYRDSHPSKIPAGRIEITLDPGQRLETIRIESRDGRGSRALRGRRARGGVLQRGAARRARARAGRGATVSAPADAGDGRERGSDRFRPGQPGGREAGVSAGGVRRRARPAVVRAGRGARHALRRRAGLAASRRRHALRRGGHGDDGRCRPAGACEAPRTPGTRCGMGQHCESPTRPGGPGSGANRRCRFPIRRSSVTTTWSATSTARRRGAARRPCRSRAYGRPTRAVCRRGRATTTTTSTRR